MEPTITPEVVEIIETTTIAVQDNSQIITRALEITGIGMLILFLSLVIIWGAMELLVRFVKDAPESDDEPDSVTTTETDEGDDFAMKAKVAAAAAGYVLSKKG